MWYSHLSLCIILWPGNSPEMEATRWKSAASRLCFQSTNWDRTEIFHDKKDVLAVALVCEHYNIALHFLIETDHKPLVSLLSSKNLFEIPIRVQQFFWICCCLTTLSYTCGWEKSHHHWYTLQTSHLLTILEWQSVPKRGKSIPGFCGKKHASHRELTTGHAVTMRWGCNLP